MRDEETKDLYKDLDHLFGFKNVYSRTHEMFITSFIYLLNGSYTPKVRNRKLVPDLSSWKGNLRGIVALRPKGWTILTVIIILKVAVE
ncbi:RNA-directed RNA polymerase L [Anthophora plagiata]